jgi:hypothetical protein
MLQRIATYLSKTISEDFARFVVYFLLDSENTAATSETSICEVRCGQPSPAIITEELRAKAGSYRIAGLAVEKDSQSALGVWNIS